MTYQVAPGTREVTAARAFADQNIVDRIVNVAVATHEGQRFDRLNQAILLLTATGLLLLLALDRTLLPRLPATRRWLGLAPTPAPSPALNTPDHPSRP